ncbi:MAG: type II toxin-antitoxin system Phd/YefM family antitoxin [Chloroflexi bacterium]|nr:type II toxin-antitoxin system Phd/YefM family antitoxin [Chloroflexota bacterium]
MAEPDSITVRTLLQHFKSTVATARQTGAPVIIALRHRQPAAVLLAFETWQALRANAADLAAQLAAARQRSADLAAELAAARDRAANLADQLAAAQAQAAGLTAALEAARPARADLAPQIAPAPLASSGWQLTPPALGGWGRVSP